MSISSAGFHHEEGRPADPVMVEIAAEFGLDMHHIRSTCLNEQLLRNSDVIFVMEKSHYDKLVALYSATADRIYLLGAHPGSSARPVEIADPYGRAREAYLTCYREIVEAVDRIKGVLALRNGN